jgi:DNA-directed RNA polymerase subunit RPC12/RpoP
MLLALSSFMLLKKGDGIDLKCPVCSGKLDIDMKLKAARCHSCGWHKILYGK